MTANSRSIVENEVDRLFNELNARYGTNVHNPVTGGEFVWGIDPIEPQKEDARRALGARERFANNGPADAQPLPVSYQQREDQKHGGVRHVVAWYARSLEALDYDVKRHPSFDDFACGVMARPETPQFVRSDRALRRRFPPRHLDGLAEGMMWDPPTSKIKRRIGAA